MRNYFHIDHYLSELEKDIYYQPQKGDDHYIWAKNVIEQWVAPLEVREVLDVGCGVGFCEPMFEALDVQYYGITMDSDDLKDAWDDNRWVDGEDYNFITANDNSYELVFARHALEHSPMPIITLMEWHRVSAKYLILVNPNPTYWGWIGKNHYSVANLEQLKFWCERAGWKVTREQIDEKEIWIQAEKVDRKIPFYER